MLGGALRLLDDIVFVDVGDQEPARELLAGIIPRPGFLSDPTEHGRAAPAVLMVRPTNLHSLECTTLGDLAVLEHGQWARDCCHCFQRSRCHHLLASQSGEGIVRVHFSSGQGSTDGSRGRTDRFSLVGATLCCKNDPNLGSNRPFLTN